MDRNSECLPRVKLVVRALPFVSAQEMFALKGGTAINLFLRELPRLSVDIDLVYLPSRSWKSAVQDMNRGLETVCQDIVKHFPNVQICQLGRVSAPKRRLIQNGHSVQIEVSPVTRCTVWPPSTMPISSAAEELFGRVSARVSSFYDVYAGKICAALSRQHVRDLFDIAELLQNEGIDRKLFETFLVYLIGGQRPIAELLQPIKQPIEDSVVSTLNSMAFKKVTADDLNDARDSLIQVVHNSLTARDREFLLSVKRMEPDWSLIDIPGVDGLPAVQFKLMNLGKMSERRHRAAVNKLRRVLDSVGSG